MNIAPILRIERKNWGALGILQVMDYSVFVYTCKVFFDITKTTTTTHAFFYDSHFAQK